MDLMRVARVLYGQRRLLLPDDPLAADVMFFTPVSLVAISKF